MPQPATDPARAPISRRAMLLSTLGAAALGGCAVEAEGSLDRYPPFDARAEPGSTGAAETTWAAARALGPGINYGNMLEAPREGDWGLRVDPAWAAVVADAGFRHVRLPVRWSNHASLDESAVIDPAFIARVQTVVDGLLARGLTVVLNMHHYRQLDGDALDAGEARAARSVLRGRFLALWAQIGERFQGYPPQLWFELYNEPHGDQTPARWNDLASRALRLLRTGHPARIVVIGPTNWNNPSALATLALPPDPRLVATFHHYDPMRFTHQGADWAGDEFRRQGVLCCDATQRPHILAPLSVAAEWSKAHNTPVWLGEFGAYGGPPGKPNDMASRAAWTRLVRVEADRLGIPWTYWEFASGFGAYDWAGKRWYKLLREALLGA